MKKIDKAAHLRLKLIPSAKIGVPSLAAAIANIELAKESVSDVGDHRVVFGRVKNFAVDPTNEELPLLSIGPKVEGFTLLRKHGIHRIATVRV